MLDTNLLRKQLDDVVARLATRPFAFPVEEFNALEAERKSIQKETEDLCGKRRGGLFCWVSANFKVTSGTGGKVVW